MVVLDHTGVHLFAAVDIISGMVLLDDQYVSRGRVEAVGVDVREVGVDVFPDEVDHDALSTEAEDYIGVVHGDLFTEEVGVVVHVFLQHGIAGGFHVRLFFAVDAGDRCVLIESLKACGVVGFGEGDDFAVGDGEEAVGPEFEVGEEFLCSADGEARGGHAAGLGADVPAVLFVEFLGEYEEAHPGVVPELFFVGGFMNLAETVPFHVATVKQAVFGDKVGVMEFAGALGPAFEELFFLFSVGHNDIDNSLKIIDYSSLI